MDTRLIVDEEHHLKEMQMPENPNQPKVLRIVAKIISYVFHPLFIPVYVVFFLVYIQPFLYAGFSEWDKSKIIISAILMYTFFPLVTVGLLKALKFIDSIFLKTQKDRIIPYVVCGIWYFWMWYVWHNLLEIPREQVSLSLAIFLASAAGLIGNIYLKVSMHAIAVGVMCTFMTSFVLSQEINFGKYLAISFLITGLVCTARLIASDHSQKEIYAGLIIGIASQIIANWFS